MTAAGHWPLGTYTLTMTFRPPARNQGPGHGGQQGPGQLDQDDEGSRNRPRRSESGKAPKNAATCTFQVQEFKAPRHFVEIDFQRLSRAETSYVNLNARQRNLSRSASPAPTMPAGR